MKRQFFDLKPDEVLVIGEERITFQRKSGQVCRVMVESTKPTQRIKPLQQPIASPPATTLKRPG